MLFEKGNENVVQVAQLRDFEFDVRSPFFVPLEFQPVNGTAAKNALNLSQNRKIIFAYFNLEGGTHFAPPNERCMDADRYAETSLTVSESDDAIWIHHCVCPFTS